MLSNFCEDMRPIAATLLLLFTVISNGNTKLASAADAKLIEGAKKEGRLILYVTLSVDHATRLVSAFNSIYPFIKVELLRLEADRLLTRILAEASAGKFPDIVIQNGMETHILTKKGLLGAYHSPERAGIPKGFKDEDGRWTNFYDNINVIAYNTQQVPAEKAPKSFQDLLHPQWKGKMGMDFDEVEWVANVLQIMGREKGTDLMRRLHAQEITFRSSHTLLAQLVVAGDHAICIVCYNYRIEELKKKGAPIEWVPAEPVIAEQHPVALFARTPNPNAARLFIDFALSKEGGQKVMREVSRVPARRDLEPDPPRLTRGLNLHPTDPSLVDREDEIRKQFRELFPTAVAH